jgi:outer membrane protein TolC
LKGDWWTLFNDPQLNTLEAQIDPANQTLKQAEANFRAARAAVRFNRASEAPTIGVAPSVGAVRDSNHQPYLNISGANNGEGDFTLPFDLNYEIDLWGRVRRTVTQAREQAQASAADLETSRLSLHAELAVRLLRSAFSRCAKQSFFATRSRPFRAPCNLLRTATTEALRRSPM